MKAIVSCELEQLLHILQTAALFHVSVAQLFISSMIIWPLNQCKHGQKSKKIGTLTVAHDRESQLFDWLILLTHLDICTTKVLLIKYDTFRFGWRQAQSHTDMCYGQFILSFSFILVKRTAGMAALRAHQTLLCYMARRHE